MIDKEMNELEKQCQKIWDELGSWWDSSVMDGDYFHQAFVFPSIVKLLELQGGELILDAGCGNGALSRLIHQRGGEVLGVDFSSSLIKQAQERSPDIQYKHISLTDTTSLLELSKSKQFDRVVCSMVLHDMPTVTPFFKSLRTLLKPNGYFIFSLPHPCFNSPSVQFEPKACLTIRDYQDQTMVKMRSKPGQPIEQLVFHRPIQTYFNLLIAEGMVMNGFEEPCVDPKILPEESLWRERSRIPPALISRWIFANKL